MSDTVKLRIKKREDRSQVWKFVLGLLTLQCICSVFSDSPGSAGLITFAKAGRQQFNFGGNQGNQRQKKKEPEKPEDDYYGIMGLKKTATAAEIKKQFKKLAIKYHPDKNPDDEESKKKFQEIASAYDVLSDPERRKIFDAQGAEGVRKDQAGQGQGGQNMDDIFSQFFKQGGQQQQREIIPDLFKETDVVQLDLSSIFQFYRRQEIWVLYFYNPKLEECKKFKEDYVALSEKLYGIVKVGSINCLEEEELCEEFGVYDIPQLLVVTEELGDEGEKYKGKMDLQSMASAATKKMQSFVNFVNTDNYETAFVQRDRETKNKIILFTDKKSTPAVFKALSKKYKDRLLFGEVRKSDEALCAKFSVTEFPTIIALTDPENYQFEKYSGEMKVDQLQKFMGGFAYSTPKKNLSFQNLTEKKFKAGSLCPKSQTNLCLIIFAGSEEIKVKQTYKFSTLVEEFASEKIYFTYVYTADYPQMQSTLFQGQEAVLYKPKRKTFINLPTSSAEDMSASISDALGGGGSWQKINAEDMFSLPKDEL